jgi:hypothetical protein
MTIPIRGAIAAVIVTVVGLPLTACAGSSTSPPQRAAGRIALLREVRAARASDTQLSIFPVSIRGRSRCSIPIAYVGFITSKPPPLHGICQTRVHSARNRHEPLTIVVFSETWRWPRFPCPPGAFCPVALPRPKMFHSWIVWVKPPMILGEKPVVLGTHQRGTVAPQAPKT